VSREFRGTAYGLYSIITGVCFSVNNIAGGFICNNYHITMASAYGASLSRLNIVMIVFINRYSTFKPMIYCS
jgi:hypothetical protein